MTNEELEARLAHHSESLKAGLTAALKPFCDSMLESARIAEEGPTNRLRQNLVAGCYQIRLKALVEDATEYVVKYSPEVHARLAQLALADAEAVLAVLANSKEA